MVNFYDTRTAMKINTIRLKNRMRSLKNTGCWELINTLISVTWLIHMT